MRKVYLILLTLALSACGKPYQDPMVAAIVDQFTKDAAAHGRIVSVSTEIEFGDVSAVLNEPNTIAACQLNLNKITLDKTWWDNNSPVSRQMMLYHELGHCVLGKQHDPTFETTVTKHMLPLVAPASIMNPQVVLDTWIAEATPSYYQGLLNNLFM